MFGNFIEKLKQGGVAGPVDPSGGRGFVPPSNSPMAPSTIDPSGGRGFVGPMLAQGEINRPIKPTIPNPEMLSRPPKFDFMKQQAQDPSRGRGIIGPGDALPERIGEPSKPADHMGIPGNNTIPQTLPQTPLAPKPVTSQPMGMGRRGRNTKKSSSSLKSRNPFKSSKFSNKFSPIRTF